ncbi:Uncharacterised protein [Vibrio cholerae]|nr:Uncharacterised protein [Vibrio cholerae]
MIFSPAGPSSIPSMMPRRRFKSPTTSPIQSSGVVISTFINGSRRTG